MAENKSEDGGVKMEEPEEGGGRETEGGGGGRKTEVGGWRIHVRTGGRSEEVEESSQRSKAKRQRSKPRRGVEGRRLRKAGRAATESSGLACLPRSAWRRQAGFGLASAGRKERR